MPECLHTCEFVSIIQHRLRIAIVQKLQHTVQPPTRAHTYTNTWAHNLPTAWRSNRKEAIARTFLGVMSVWSKQNRNQPHGVLCIRNFVCEFPAPASEVGGE